MVDKLSWDLFVIVFFVTIIAYSFIIGRDNTLKVIIGTYIAALAGDAIGNIFGTYFTGSQVVAKVLNNALIANDAEAVILIKVFLFILFVIVFSIKGTFNVNTDCRRSGAVRLVILVILGFLSAAFIMSTLIVYASGVSFVDGAISGVANVELQVIFQNSKLVQILADYYNFWFALPAITLLFSGFLLKSGNE